VKLFLMDNQTFLAMPEHDAHAIYERYQVIVFTFKNKMIYFVFVYRETWSTERVRTSQNYYLKQSTSFRLV
jgi:hypothetical protein